VWSDYIAFLKSAKAGNQYEKSMNMNKLRKAYQAHLLDLIFLKKKIEKSMSMNQLRRADQAHILNIMCVCMCV
jgi:hypothetical protein